MTLTCAHPCHSHEYRLETTGGIVGDIDMCTSMSFPWVQTGSDRRIVGDIDMCTSMSFTWVKTGDDRRDSW